MHIDLHVNENELNTQTHKHKQTFCNLAFISVHVFLVLVHVRCCSLLSFTETNLGLYSLWIYFVQTK